MKASMSSIYLPVLLLFLFADHAATANDIICGTCEKCGRGDPNLDCNFCVASLQAVPHSQCTNLTELGHISIKLLRYNITNTRFYVKELLKNPQIDSYMKGCLQDCLDLYSDAIPTLEQALQDYKTKHYNDANIHVSSVLDAGVTCEDGFKEKDGVVSPLTKRNNDTIQLSAISLCIMNKLH